MKLLDYNPAHMEMLLDTATKMSNLNREAYFATETATEEGVSLFRYTELTNNFYRQMIGLTLKDVLRNFGTPGTPSGRVAWYKGKSDTRGTSLQGPTGYTGYIPDCVESVIITENLSPKQKHELLKVMMLDLLKLKAAYDYKDSLFSATT